MNDAAEAALQRIDASRAALRAELIKLRSPRNDSRDAQLPSAAWWEQFPALRTMSRALRLWWRRHPARPVVDIASEAGAQAIAPIVRTHPVGAIVLSMAVGAAMVVWRPWRSRLTAAVWAGLGAQLTSGLARSLVSTDTLTALMQGLRRPGASASAPTTHEPARTTPS